MKNYSNINGLTMLEIIITISILGIVMCPLMSIFIMSQHISINSNIEYKSLLQAQKYIEEVNAMSELDTELYIYNSELRIYERNIFQTENSYGARVTIRPYIDGLYFIDVIIKNDGNVINSLEGSIIFK